MKTQITSEILPVDGSNNESGIVHAANESRFALTNYNESLTAYTMGWKDHENIESLLNFIAPVVLVGKRFEFKKTSNDDAFLTESDDVRAIGSAFKRVEFGGNSTMGKTFNKGLTVRVDHDDVVGDDWQERHVQLLIKRLYRNELRRSIAALDAAAIASPKTWGGTANQQNPDADLRSSLAVASDDAGARPNRILFGEGAWDIRSNVYDIQTTAAAQRAAALSMKELARKLFVDEIRILGARYQGENGQKAKILGNDIYLFNAHNDLMKDEPANIKRFVTPIDGSNFRVYVEEGAKFTDITVEHYSNIIITSPSGIQKISISDGSAD